MQSEKKEPEKNSNQVSNTTVANMLNAKKENGKKENGDEEKSKEAVLQDFQNIEVKKSADSEIAKNSQELVKSCLKPLGDLDLAEQNSKTDEGVLEKDGIDKMVENRERQLLQNSDEDEEDSFTVKNGKNSDEYWLDSQFSEIPEEEDDERDLALAHEIEIDENNTSGESKGAQKSAIVDKFNKCPETSENLSQKKCEEVSKDSAVVQLEVDKKMAEKNRKLKIKSFSCVFTHLDEALLFIKKYPKISLYVEGKGNKRIEAICKLALFLIVQGRNVLFFVDGNTYISVQNELNRQKQMLLPDHLREIRSLIISTEDYSRRGAAGCWRKKTNKARMYFVDANSSKFVDLIKDYCFNQKKFIPDTVILENLHDTSKLMRLYSDRKCQVVCGGPNFDSRQVSNLNIQYKMCDGCNLLELEDPEPFKVPNPEPVKEEIEFQPPQSAEEFGKWMTENSAHLPERLRDAKTHSEYIELLTDIKTDRLNPEIYENGYFKDPHAPEKTVEIVREKPNKFARLLSRYSTRPSENPLNSESAKTSNPAESNSGDVEKKEGTAELGGLPGTSIAKQSNSEKNQENAESQVGITDKET